MKLFLDKDISEIEESNITVSGPSGATMSRAKLKLDLAHMLLRRAEVQRWMELWKHVIQLCGIATIMGTKLMSF